MSSKLEPFDAQPPPRRLIVLDGLRGGAALFVFGYHMQISFGAARSLARGYLMVDLFFMLSGFVMVLAADRKLAHGMGTPLFMAARLLRLWPVIAVGVLVGAVCAAGDIFSRGVTLHTTRIMVQLVVASLLLVPYPWRHRSGALFPLNGPHWSLMFEVGANIFHGLALWRLRAGSLGILALVFAAALAWTVWTLGLDTAGPFFRTAVYGIPRVGFCYIVGMLLARRWRVRRGRAARASVPWPLALAVPAVIMVTLDYWPTPKWLGDLAVVFLVFPICLWWAATCQAPGRVAGISMKSLGALSYPLYALHGPILTTVRGNDSAARAFMAISLCVVLASVLALATERGPWSRFRKEVIDTARRKRIDSGKKHHSDDDREQYPIGQLESIESATNHAI